MIVNAIEVDDLARSFGATAALVSVSFAVPPGQVCGYLGANGAGKSTTMRILAGLLEPSRGSVRVLGHDVQTDPIAARRLLGYLPESGALYRLLSPREHLTLLSDLYDLAPAVGARRAEELLARFDLAQLADRRIDTLSKGQRQKVAIACALLHSPEVVLLDEPLNGLDVHAARTLKDILSEIVARGGTVLYSSHILDVVERVCERAIIISSGRIVADSPTRELVAKSRDHTLESVFHDLVRSDSVVGLEGAFDSAAATMKDGLGPRRTS